MTRLRCGMTESYLSALVDDALSARARERVAVHVLHCSVCTETVAGLRRTSELLKDSSRDSTPRDRLADRLLAIPADTPATSATSATSAGPAPAPAAQERAVTPSGPRRVRVAAAGLALILALAGGTAAVGWVNAPSAEEPVADPAIQARLDYVAASAQRPLAASATDVVMTVPARQLEVSERVLGGVPVRPGERLGAPQVAELIDAARAAASRLSYTGDWAVAVAGDGTPLSALVTVRAAAGEGTVLDVADRQGRAIQSNFLPAAAPSRLDVASTGAGELAATVTAVGGQRVTGRDAIVVEHRDAATTTTTRWWLDRATGLVLRREVWQGPTLTEAGGFTALRFLDGGSVGGVSERISPAATSATLTMSAAMALRDQGWYCNRAVGGLSLLSARSDAGSAPGVLALTYGDATRTVTVLQRPGSLPDRLDGFVRDDARGVQVRPGWPTMVTWESAGVVFTVTSAAPAPTTDAVVADLPHHASGSSSAIDRIRAGWDRVGSQVFG